MRVSVWRLQLQAIPVPIMFRFVTATPFDLNTPLGQRRAIIRRNGDAVEMVEAGWGLPPTPNPDRAFALVRAEGRTFPTHRCLVPASDFRLPGRGRASRFSLAYGDCSIWPVFGGQQQLTGPNPMRS